MALPFETATQFAALGLTLVGGWFIGLASRSGGAKWRERYQDEELEHARYRDEAEERIRALQAELATIRRQAPVPAPVVEDAPGAGWRRRSQGPCEASLSSLRPVAAGAGRFLRLPSRPAGFSLGFS